MKATAEVEGTRAGPEAEWQQAERVERVEMLKARVEALRTERERLRTDLRVAQLWVKELALWLDEVQARKGGKALALSGMTLHPRTVAALREHAPEPIVWRGLLTVAAVAAALWVIVAGLVSLVWLAL